MAEISRRPPHSVAVIERWVGELAREQGLVVGRLQRWVQLMVVLAALAWPPQLAIYPSWPAARRPPGATARTPPPISFTEKRIL